MQLVTLHGSVVSAGTSIGFVRSRVQFGRRGGWRTFLNLSNFKLMKGKPQPTAESENKNVNQVTMFGINFNYVLGSTVFLVSTSLIAMLTIAEGWEM